MCWNLPTDLLGGIPSMVANCTLKNLVCSFPQIVSNVSTIFRISADFVYVCTSSTQWAPQQFKCNINQVEKLEFRSYCAWIRQSCQTIIENCLYFFHGWNFVFSQCRCANYRPSQWMGRECLPHFMQHVLRSIRLSVWLHLKATSFTAFENKERMFNLFSLICSCFWNTRHLVVWC